MAHHEINKNKIKNDIILTIALAIAMLGVRQFMFLTNLMEHEWDVAIFLVLSFFAIKFTYNFLTKIVEDIENSDWYKNLINIRKERDTE